MNRLIVYNEQVAAACFDYRNGVIENYHPIVPELLPRQIADTSADGFSYWLQQRSIDLNNVRHRKLMNTLFGTRDRIALAILTNMFSLTDTFTCFPEGCYLPRETLCDIEQQDRVSDFILVSGDTSLQRAKIITPNASTDGSFSKTWKYQDGAWWLYKLQSAEASKTEYEISMALRAAGWDAAEYRYDGNKRTRVRTRNFVGEHEFFEPYDSFRFAFADKTDQPDVVRNNLASLGGGFEQAWRRILLADALFMNTDRHMRNFGVIRSSRTGKVLRLAPNFDNNQAYRAVQGVRYSSAMLKEYMDSADQSDQSDLAVLHDQCAKRAYLKEAAEAARRFL